MWERAVTTEENIFLSFHKSSVLLNDLSKALRFMQEPYSRCGVCVLKILTCNAAFSYPFTSASCICDAWRINDRVVGYGVNSIFQDGFQVLEQYIGSPESLPASKGAKMALSRLLHFLADDIKDAENALTDVPTDVTETKWTMILAHHLLSKLTISSTYKLDVLSTGTDTELKCSCKLSEMISGTYGDTSIGVPACWHGRVDILIEDVPVHVAVESADSDSSVEVKATPDRMGKSREQIRAQAVVSSFWQKKLHPDLNNFLIPNIAFSKKKLAFCFYDCENDVLLETPLLDIFFEGKILYKPSIILLWFALNFKYFCSGLPEDIKNTGFKADLFRVLGDKVEIYRHDVIAPCGLYKDHTDQWYDMEDIIQ